MTKQTVYFPLHGPQAEVEEHKFRRIIKKHFAEISNVMKKYTSKHAEKVNVVGEVLKDSSPIIDEYIKEYDEEFNALKTKIVKDYFDFYVKTAKVAMKRITLERQRGHPITDDTEDDEYDYNKSFEEFVSESLLQYLQQEAAERVTRIDETTRKYLRDQLGEAYKNHETTAQWQKRIDKVMGLNYPSGRADMIARTELAWAYSRGLISGYHDIGVEHVRWLAVMDSRTCPKCAARHEKRYLLRDIEGEIPAHPRCRCTLVNDDY
jgi:SPP1 gp7 family putative phage head morphogenesis protein